MYGGPKLVQPTQATTDSELIKLWLIRYLPTLGVISAPVRRHVKQRLELAISDDARRITQQKILRSLPAACARATTEAQQFLSVSGVAYDIWEVRDLTIQIHKIYETLLSCYAESFVFAPMLDCLETIDSEQGRMDAATRILPSFNQLIWKLEPLLRELKMLYRFSSNRQMIGFMTTQLHFTQRHIIRQFDPYERLWLTSYFQMVEELICMPWRRICTSTLLKTSRLGSIALAKKMLPRTQAIAESVYRRALCDYPHHVSRQGRIQTEAVRTSSIRDINMFQAYLWLCLLENSLSVIENELLPLCLIVFPSTNVQWQLVTQGVENLMVTIQAQLSASEKTLFDKYAQPIQQLFVNANPEYSRALVSA